MRLYHFTSERFGLEEIRRHKLKIARIEELNDPFEFLGLALNTPERQVLRDVKKEMASQYGLICLSSRL